MYFATRSRRTQILIWLIWLIACLVFLAMPEQAAGREPGALRLPSLGAVVTHDARNGPLFPWQPRWRFRKWAWRRARRRAQWVARLAWLAMTGALTLAQLVDLVTQSQLRRHLGALPVLYGVLETLRVREIINLGRTLDAISAHSRDIWPDR